jgi:hypothetical protein
MRLTLFGGHSVLKLLFFICGNINFGKISKKPWPGPFPDNLNRSSHSKNETNFGFRGMKNYRRPWLTWLPGLFYFYFISRFFSYFWARLSYGYLLFCLFLEGYLCDKITVFNFRNSWNWSEVRGQLCRLRRYMHFETKNQAEPRYMFSRLNNINIQKFRRRKKTFFPIFPFL